MDADRDQLTGSRFVVVAGMIGAVGGGAWTELAFERFTSTTGTTLDLVALLIFGTLLLVLAWYVWRAGGRLALLLYLVMAGVGAAIGPALMF